MSEPKRRGFDDTSGSARASRPSAHSEGNGRPTRNHSAKSSSDPKFRGDHKSRDDRGERKSSSSSGQRNNYSRDSSRQGRSFDKPARQSRDSAVHGRSTRNDGTAKKFYEAPPLPEGIEASDLDEDVRRDLRTLPRDLAATVGKHLAAAGALLDVDPEAALVHAQYAKDRASRVPAVREALGLVAYRAGKWADALSELRAVRRMTHTDIHIAIIADAERALGRPDRALELAKEVNRAALPPDVAVELRIVAAGARRDLGQFDAAVISLQGKDLNPNQIQPWSVRLFYAYADNLVAAGRRDEAITWFLHAADADLNEETDAAERAAKLSDN